MSSGQRLETSQPASSYEKIFDFCLKTPFTEVEVEDPWIQSPHQLHAFVAFCELVVAKSPSLKKIILRTQTKDDRQQEALAEITTSLRLHGVELQVKFGTFHDREIRCSLLVNYSCIVIPLTP